MGNERVNMTVSILKVSRSAEMGLELKAAKRLGFSEAKVRLFDYQEPANTVATRADTFQTLSDQKKPLVHSPISVKPMKPVSAPRVQAAAPAIALPVATLLQQTVILPREDILELILKTFVFHRSQDQALQVFAEESSSLTKQDTRIQDFFAAQRDRLEIDFPIFYILLDLNELMQKGLSPKNSEASKQLYIQCVSQWALWIHQPYMTRTLKASLNQMMKEEKVSIQSKMNSTSNTGMFATTMSEASQMQNHVVRVSV